MPSILVGLMLSVLALPTSALGDSGSPEPPTPAAVPAPDGAFTSPPPPALPQQQQQEEEQREPPPYPDSVGGFVLSTFAGNVFSGSNALQIGGALAFFIPPRAQIGFEIEGNFTRGPGGDVMQLHGSLVVQAGARTSKIVPYAAVGGGFMRATLDLPTATDEELRRLGVPIEPESESGPAFNAGGGVRFYLRESIALRGDFRNYWVIRNTDDGFFDRLFVIRRIAGMLSFEF